MILFFKGKEHMKMLENTNDICTPSDYAAPECTLIRFGKEDILTSSSIYLPMQPLHIDDLDLNCADI